jgi:hypothetical protein
VCGDDARSGGGNTCRKVCSYSVGAACLTVLLQRSAPAAAQAGGGSIPMLGVSPLFLEAFKRKWQHVIRGRTTEQVCRQLVKTLTSRSVCGNVQAAGSDDVGEANLFLSQRGAMCSWTLWMLPWGGTVFIWFDVFFTSQHPALDIPSSQQQTACCSASLSPAAVSPCCVLRQQRRQRAARAVAPTAIRRKHTPRFVGIPIVLLSFTRF